MGSITYIGDKTLLQKKGYVYVLDVKKFSHQIVDLTMELRDLADEENIKNAVDQLVENIKQNYENIDFII